MGNRAECPACKACSSDVYQAINYDISDCPYCDCPHDLLVKWDEMRPILEKMRNLNFEKSIIEKMEGLEQENAKLKTKIYKIEMLIAWKELDDLFEPIVKVKEILKGE